MTLATFTPPIAPSPGMSDTPQIKILAAEFGDGYSQATPDGLNHIRRQIELTWEILETDQKEEILDFLRSQKGTTPFRYRVPGDQHPTAFICAQWSVKALAADLFSITATFRQHFGALA